MTDGGNWVDGLGLILTMVVMWCAWPLVGDWAFAIAPVGIGLSIAASMRYERSARYRARRRGYE